MLPKLPYWWLQRKQTAVSIANTVQPQKSHSVKIGFQFCALNLDQKLFKSSLSANPNVAKNYDHTLCSYLFWRRRIYGTTPLPHNVSLAPHQLPIYIYAQQLAVFIRMYPHRVHGPPPSQIISTTDRHICIYIILWPIRRPTSETFPPTDFSYHHRL